MTSSSPSAKPAAGFLRTLWRIARQLFHEITGAAFATFAVAWGLSAWRDWRQGMSTWLIILAAAFTLMMTLFAVAAFCDARRVR
jgi:membrane-bound metal-dependent hydrolase YbcI (DUF457 family)